MIARVSIALLCLTGSLALSASAEAGWQIERAQQIANVVWHHPCASQGIKIEWPRALVSGWSDVPGGGTAVWGTVDEAGCVVFLNPHRHYSWPVLCAVVLHETGHLAGFNDPTNGTDPAHSSNPHSVMYESFERPDPRCANRGRPFLERRGLLG